MMTVPFQTRVEIDILRGAGAGVYRGRYGESSQDRTFLPHNHAGRVTSQIAEVSVLKELLRVILSANAELQPRPVPALVEEIDGEKKAAREMCLDGG